MGDTPSGASRPHSKAKLGLVLSAGGARAAYQVGVLRGIGELFPDFRPKIFAGLSAGSINAAFLAQGDSMAVATEELYQLWLKLKFEQVFRTNFKSLLSMFNNLLHDLFLSKLTRKLRFTSILDASPLADTLLGHIYFPKIFRALRSGTIEGLAVSCTNYNTGENTVFFDSTDKVTPWQRQRRRSVRTPIRARHIMASCSIPLLFEPVRIGNYFFGDGAIRFRFPLSPAVHLGATHILAIGISPMSPLEVAPTNGKHLSVGIVAGSVLNSIFIDALEIDYENLCRMNDLAGESPRVKKIESILLRPSEDLGHLAQKHVQEAPFHFRQLIKAAATRSADLGDLVSYLLFSPGYIKDLMELGYQDAKAKQKEIGVFLESAK